MVRSTREDPIGFTAKARLVLVTIGIEGFEVFRLLNTLLDDEICHGAPRTLCKEANNFKSTIARIFENGINDSNLTEGRHINGLEVFIRRKVNEYGFRLAIKVLEELFCQRRLPKIVQISTALITESGAHF